MLKSSNGWNRILNITFRGLKSYTFLTYPYENKIMHVMHAKKGFHKS